MGFTIRQDEAAVKAAYRFQVNASLLDIRLLGCALSTPEFFEPTERAIRLGLNMGSAVLESDKANAVIAVELSVFGDLDDDGASADHHLFEVRCRYGLKYSLRPGYVPSADEIEAFKEGNAIFQCWPYSRELVNSLTMRMGMPIPPLPFLRLQPKPPKKATTPTSARKSRKSIESAEPQRS
jgi:hypothetical protein